MSDERFIEKSTEHVDWLRDQEISNHVAKVPTPRTTNGDDNDCEDCGNEVPRKRWEMGYSICVECATVKEKKGV